MEIPVFLAMTAGEVLRASQLPRHPAWMACHFSPYGTGLSNLPPLLPEGSMLILNDRLPPDWHDPVLAADMLLQTAEEQNCRCILLDFQRPENDKTASVVEAVLKSANCPVGVSSCYGAAFACPVFLPPLLPHIPLQDYLAPWKGREIWLELSQEGTEITVTAEGSEYTSLPFYQPGEQAHRETDLHCHYEIHVSNEKIIFQLGRRKEDFSALLEEAKGYSVTKAVGLWQELGQNEG